MLRSLILFVALPMLCNASSTEDLVSILKPFRGTLQLNLAQRHEIHTHFVDWVEQQLKQGASLEQMNQRLREADLIREQMRPESPDRSGRVGFLGSIEKAVVGSPEALLAFRLPIHTGPGCSLDEAVAIYQQNPIARIATIHADNNPKGHPMYLAGLALSAPTNGGERVIASGWFSDSCNGSWANVLRKVDRTSSTRSKVLFGQWFVGRRFNFEADVNGSMIRFLFEPAIKNTDLMSTQGIAKYELVGTRLTRISPLALTRAGFIQEWLGLSTSEAARWSSPAAIQKHAQLSTRYRDKYYTWKSASQCPDDTGVWEIAIQLDHSKTEDVFRMRADHAQDLRMISVSSTRSPSCQPNRIDQDLTSVDSPIP